MKQRAASLFVLVARASPGVVCNPSPTALDWDCTVLSVVVLETGLGLQISFKGGIGLWGIIRPVKTQPAQQ